MPEAYLLLEEADQVWRVHLTHARMRLGRAADCDVVIRDARVAAQHALLYFNGAEFAISRAGAAPVYVDGVAIVGSQPLRNGDVVDVAGIHLTYVQVGARSDTLLQLGIRTDGAAHWFALLDRPVLRIGQAGADLLVPDPRLGAPHLTVENFGAGNVFVVPQGPEHPLALSGRPVAHRVRLRDGDQLRAGATHFVVRLFERRALPGLDAALLPPPEAPSLDAPAAPPRAQAAAAIHAPSTLPAAAPPAASGPVITAAPPAGRRRLTADEHELETALVPMLVAPPEVHARIRGAGAPVPRPAPRPAPGRDPEQLVETDRIPRVAPAAASAPEAAGKRADGHTLMISRDEAIEKLRRERAYYVPEAPAGHPQPAPEPPQAKRERAYYVPEDPEQRAAAAADRDHDGVTRTDVPTVPNKPWNR